MRRQRPSPIRQKPRVALIVETTLASGRAILAGIGRYLWSQAAWSVSLEARELEVSPDWLKHWKSDGITAGTKPEFRGGHGEGRRACGGRLGDCRDPRFPLIHVDNASIARAVADPGRKGDLVHVFLARCGHPGERSRRLSSIVVTPTPSLRTSRPRTT